MYMFNFTLGELFTTFGLVHRIHYYLHGEYSDEEDFPVRFAKAGVFILLAVLLIMNRVREEYAPDEEF